MGCNELWENITATLKFEQPRMAQKHSENHQATVEYLLLVLFPTHAVEILPMEEKSCASL